MNHFVNSYFTRTAFPHALFIERDRHFIKSRPEMYTSSLFPKAKTGNKFKKRMYLYRLENEELYLWIFYDHAGKPPVNFISNFHTG